jgi:hypothetical protein
MPKKIINPTTGDPAAPDPNRHQRKFAIRHHSDRDQIQQLPDQFLIDTLAIRNGSNSLKTNGGGPF